MVMTTEKECDKAYRDYSEGFFGMPWDHRLNDDEWREVRTSQSRKAGTQRGGVHSWCLACRWNGDLASPVKPARLDKAQEIQERGLTAVTRFHVT